MTECNCFQCQSGEEVNMDEWLKSPVHQQIHSEVRAALTAGEIHVQGEANEDA